MMPQSLGVIGGKPNSAHYFIGYVGECVIGVHQCQKGWEFHCVLAEEIALYPTFYSISHYLKIYLVKEQTSVFHIDLVTRSPNKHNCGK